ncbi:hypothetical protein ABPG74_001029 [Tetrahymena malaccensis]
MSQEFLVQNQNYIIKLSKKNKVPQIKRRIQKDTGQVVKDWKIYELLKGIIRKDKPGPNRIIEVEWHLAHQEINSFCGFRMVVDEYLQTKNINLTDNQLRYHYKVHKKIVQNQVKLLFKYLKKILLNICYHKGKFKVNKFSFCYLFYAGLGCFIKIVSQLHSPGINY